MSNEVKVEASVHSDKMSRMILACIICGGIGILIGLRIWNKNGNHPLGTGICIVAVLLFAQGIYLFITRKKVFEFTASDGGKFSAKIDRSRKFTVDPVGRIAFFHRHPSHMSAAAMVKIYAIFYDQSHEAVFGIYSLVPYVFTRHKEGFEWYDPDYVKGIELIYKVKMFDGPVERVFELYKAYE